MIQCVRLCVLMAVDLLPFGNDETVSTRDTNLTHTFQRFGNCSLSLKLSLCLCVLQARNISTGELAAVKIIKLEPGEYEVIVLSSEGCCVKSAA